MGNDGRRGASAERDDGDGAHGSGAAAAGSAAAAHGVRGAGFPKKTAGDSD